LFLANDSLQRRHKKIRSFLPSEPVIAILLASVDFEWTVRRAIIALGTNSNRFIRDSVLNKCHGADAYKEAWQKEVQPRLGMHLPHVVKNWSFLKAEAFALRHQVVHGLRGMPSTRKTEERVEAFLEASRAIADFAIAHNEPLFGRRFASSSEGANMSFHSHVNARIAPRGTTAEQ
jgi:hypothetical protein